MELKELIKNIAVKEIDGDLSREIGVLASDSRSVIPGSAFIAHRGFSTDGHRYIEQAVRAGANTVFCEVLPENMDPEVTYIELEDCAAATGTLAATFYGYPSQKLKVVGITGTNGKTSIATLLYQLFTALGHRSGLISTIAYKVGDMSEPASHTTPGPIKIQELMARMAEEGCEYCFMEVSSHAVHQKRIEGVDFVGGVFTNLTHDHLDYHKTFKEYLNAKKRFFDDLPSQAFALINSDDKNGSVMVQNCRARKITYGCRTIADYGCKVLETHLNGMLLRIDGQEVWTGFVGKFNASNLLAVYAVAVNLGVLPDEVLRIISLLKPVKGRFETLRSIDGKLAVVDYAHTPDALRNVLIAIDDIRTGKEQVITVVGAGGDRDTTKRPEMTQEAVEWSDKVILTSDNPRTEDPLKIIRDMEAGLTDETRGRAVSIGNRREAIRTAAMMANPGDIILIAGKGHENYQEINGVRYHFDDTEEIKKCFGIE